MEQMPMMFSEPMSYKGQLSDINGKWPQFSAVFEVLQSQEFRDLMSEISGISELLDDPILAGGGLHQSPKLGFLDLHVDANFHPIDKSLHRRLNLLIYLNSDWNPEWGGQFEIWSDRNKKPFKLAKRIAPAFNRAVIFSTTRTSWHGVTPINCTNGCTRKSIALYYYTTSRPKQESYRDSSVIWHNRTHLWKRALYPPMNIGIAVMKPYAKRLRWLKSLLGRKDIFDASENPSNKARR